MNFYILRLSFGEIELKTKEKSFSGSKMELVENLLKDNHEYNSGGGRDAIDFHMGDFKKITDSEGANIFFATIGKYKIVDIDKYDEKNAQHYEERETSSPWVSFMMDYQQQVFIIQKNKSAFSNYDKLFTSISNHLNKLLFDYGLSVSIAPISLPSDFWRQIKEYDNIYTLKFELFMPNSFGNTNQSVQEILNESKDDYNADKLTEEISNKEGKLRILPGNKNINKMVDWIGKGGGKWQFKGTKGSNTKINSVSSAKEAQSFPTTKDLDTKSLDDEHIFKITVESIIKELKRHYVPKDANEED